MSESENAFGEFWAPMPEKADHPSRVPILEAFRWIGEPLSSIGLVDLFDGENITMWEAAHHLRALELLDVVKPDPAGGVPRSKQPVFDLPYRLTIFDREEG